jgi:exonuclease VII small subunit
VAPTNEAGFHFWSLNLLIFGAAVLPVLGSCFRLLRSAFEYSRNTARFRAKYRALEQLISKLEVALGQADTFTTEEIVRYMWKGELLLENEHREWLRLMKQAEWFG